jgi:hypothetical protein
MNVYKIEKSMYKLIKGRYSDCVGISAATLTEVTEKVKNEVIPI